MASDNNKGKMSVGDAGKLGGDQTSKTHDKKFYQDIGEKGGKKGGQRVKELIDRGKEAENE